MPSLSSLVTAAIATHLDETNCVDLWEFAEQNGLAGLMEKARKTTLHHFARVETQRALMSRPHTRLADLLGDNRLRVSEVTVLDSVVRWAMKQGASPPKAPLQQLLKLVRFPLLSAEVLEEREMSRPLRRACMQMYKEQIAGVERGALQLPMARAEFTNAIFIFSRGMHDTDMDSNQESGLASEMAGGFHLYHPETSSMTTLMPTPITADVMDVHRMVVLDGVIYLLSQHPNRKPITISVHAIDPQSGTPELRQLRPLSVQRVCSSVVACAGKLYVLGGPIRGRGGRKFMDIFDPRHGTWSTAPGLPVSRTSMAVVAHNDVIYAMCGADLDVGGGHLNMVNDAYAFDTSIGAWRELPNAPSSRDRAACVAVDNKIYVIGGFNDLRYLASVEIFDPATETWTRGPSMNHSRIGHGAAVVGGKIYVIGGDAHFSNLSNSIEMLDPAEGIWRDMGEMEHAIKAALHPSRHAIWRNNMVAVCV